MSYKLQKSSDGSGGERYHITVPKALVESEGFEEGDKFTWIREGRDLVMQRE